MLDCAMMTAVQLLGCVCAKHIIIILTKTSNGSESTRRRIVLLVETCMDNTNIVKMNDNRWFQYDNDDNVCEKIVFFSSFEW